MQELLPSFSRTFFKIIPGIFVDSPVISSGTFSKIFNHDFYRNISYGLSRYFYWSFNQNLFLEILLKILLEDSFRYCFWNAVFCIYSAPKTFFGVSSGGPFEISVGAIADLCWYFSWNFANDFLQWFFSRFISWLFRRLLAVILPRLFLDIFPGKLLDFYRNSDQKLMQDYGCIFWDYFNSCSRSSRRIFSKSFTRKTSCKNKSKKMSCKLVRPYGETSKYWEKLQNFVCWI